MQISHRLGCVSIISFHNTNQVMISANSCSGNFVLPFRVSLVWRKICHKILGNRPKHSNYWSRYWLAKSKVKSVIDCNTDVSLRLCSICHLRPALCINSVGHPARSLIVKCSRTTKGWQAYRIKGLYFSECLFRVCSSKIEKQTRFALAQNYNFEGEARQLFQQFRIMSPSFSLL